MTADMRAWMLWPAILSGCATASATRSAYRDPVPERLEVDGVVLASTGAIHVHVFALVDQDLFPAGFRITGGGQAVYVDPVVVDASGPADVIFITHEHMDHLSRTDVENLSGPGTVVVCPRRVAEKLEGLPHQVVVVAPGQTGEANGIGYRTIGSYNTRSGFLGFTPHPQSDENVGYVIEVSGVRFFHPGDTDALPEMERLRGIDVALTPIAGGDLAMSTAEAAEVVNSIRPRLAIPMHYPLLNSEVDDFRELVDPGIEVKVMQITRPPAP